MSSGSENQGQDVRARGGHGERGGHEVAQGGMTAEQLEEAKQQVGSEIDAEIDSIKLHFDSGYLAKQGDLKRLLRQKLAFRETARAAYEADRSDKNLRLMSISEMYVVQANILYQRSHHRHLQARDFSRDLRSKRRDSAVSLGALRDILEKQKRILPIVEEALDLENRALQLGVAVGRELFELPDKTEPFSGIMSCAPSTMTVGKLFTNSAKDRGEGEKEVRITRIEMQDLFMGEDPLA